MTTQTLILPYQRSSPVHIPQRDLVVSAADSISLRVTVVESDDPGADALVLTGGIGGPSCMLLVYPDYCWRSHWDYGAPFVSPGVSLWSGMGVISDAIGSFDIAIPAQTMGTWPRRCRWSVLLDWDGGDQAELLAEGFLHVRPTGLRLLANQPLLTDGGTPILTTDFSTRDFG